MSHVGERGHAGQCTVHLIGGTRPEAIKLAPVAAAMGAAGRVHPVLVSSGQHPAMFEQGLVALGMHPDVVLSLTRRTGSQPELAAGLIGVFDSHFHQHCPAAVVVQGDTTTAFIAAMVAFWHRIPVVHLEAGLRSHDLSAPFPEEANRKLVAQLAALHLAPTERAAHNLAHDGVTDTAVVLIGNTVVDAALSVAMSRIGYRDARLSAIDARARGHRRRLVLVTAHRRESWGAPLDRILAAVATLVARYPDVEVVLPAHPNPAISGQVQARLGGLDRVTVTEPLSYPELIQLLAVSAVVLSDSGGIQEEAPTFGVPILVLREVTERVEGLQAGCAALVGTDEQVIVKTASAVLEDDRRPGGVANPFGDGHAGRRAEQAVAWLLGLCAEPPPPWRFAP